MPHYALARHVFVCVQGEHVVFLDVRQDRYLALDCAKTAGLGDIVAGWPVASPASETNRGSLSAVISLLLDKQILTAADSGKSAAPVTSEVPRGDVITDVPDEEPRVSLVGILRFARSAIRASLMLKYRSLESTVARVSARRQHCPAAQDMPDIERVGALVEMFATLRPFFFTAKDACLFDALALSEFLASYGVYPNWVFAVQARPFAAHCWLQLGPTVLNDTVEHVRRYTPIMVA